MHTEKSSVKKKTIVLLAMPNTRLLDIAGPSDVFATAANIQHPDQEVYELLLASATGHLQVMTASGIAVTCHINLMDIDFPIDTLLIGGFSLAAVHQLSAGFFEWLEAHYPSIRRMGSVCSGAFALARAGLLNNRHATTHWQSCERLALDFPQVKVDSSPFFVKDGNIYTSGGVTSGMDLAIALVEEDLGREVALQVARRLVLHLKRPGGQVQFSSLLPSYDLESPLVARIHPWLIKNVQQDIKVEDMAAQASMSPRNFARVFGKEKHMTPAKYLEKLRVEVARQYLEHTDLSMEQIAERCGLGGQVSMRRTFLRHLRISPSYYRTAFRTALPEEVA
ncbi:transcriptional regulator, AraC family with amidase-like domain [Chitinophaga costaii]|uniref:Transcriptional regulator, AraC family with amidase-like domain n=1 Tax=Chitinophaga costaii TaxID=1335309 RepID=A0A1C4F8A5_9BACT|nr:GlxA family transcriptional regulator [Chitinophaga costaii]PUZ21192.1 GlxA family transcriptional regulator [Chitinophaga costaii]SCC52170.1 transcriptional regulator, AraC family with amidase-like domain [Chitinophaga costaii]